MSDAIFNESYDESRWTRINILFLKYRDLRDEKSRNELSAAVVKAYTPDFVKAKRPDWSDRWRDEVYSRLYAKFTNVLNDPKCVKKGKDGRYKLTAYMSSAFYSAAADVYRHYSKEDKIAKEAQAKVADHKNLQEMKFEEIVWNTAINMPGKRGEVFRFYVLSLISKSEGVPNREYTIAGIASKLSLTQTCVSTHISRAKMSLERELRPLGLKMGVLSHEGLCR